MSAFARRLRTVVRRLRPVARPHRRWLLLGSLGTLLVVACRLALPWPLKGVVDLAIAFDARAPLDLDPVAGGRVYWLAGAFVAIAVAQGFAELVQRLSFARFAIGLVHDARAEALGRVQREGAGGRDPGDLIARVVGDSARLKSGLKGVLIRFTQNGTFFVGVCVMLLIIDLRLGAVFVAGGTVILVVAAFGASRVARISQRLRKREGRIAAHLHAVMSGREGDDELDAVERRVGHAEAKTTRLEGLVMWTVHALLALTTCTIVILGLHGVRAGRLEPGDLVAVLFYLLLVHNPTVRLGRQAVRVGRVLASAERLVGAMDDPARPVPAAERDTLPAAGAAA